MKCLLFRLSWKIVKRKATGDEGERLALDFLRKKGYRILETNFRCRAGEIDIIARQRENLVFIEVRAKTNINFGLPEESISFSKRQHLEGAVESYLQQHPEYPTSWRIDLVAIELDADNRVKRIEQIEDAIEG
jgi:putative endonuclease